MSSNKNTVHRQNSPNCQRSFLIQRPSWIHSSRKQMQAVKRKSESFSEALWPSAKTLNLRRLLWRFPGSDAQFLLQDWEMVFDADC